MATSVEQARDDNEYPNELRAEDNWLVYVLRYPRKVVITALL